MVSGGNQNGMGGLADAFLEAFGPTGQSLGVRAISGVATIDVSALFGGAQILSLRLTAAGDSQQIGRLRFRAAPLSGGFLLLRNLGALHAPSVRLCDVTIAGSADVVLFSTGLGIDGATSPTLLDGSEWVRFDFDVPQTSVAYETEAVGDANGNGTGADAFVEGYDASGGSLGLVPVSGNGSHDVTTFFGGARLSGFRVIANTDAQRLALVTYAPAPAAGALGAAAAFALALLGVLRAPRRDY